jgi:hypothetical protein
MKSYTLQYSAAHIVILQAGRRGGVECTVASTSGSYGRSLALSLPLPVAWAALRVLLLTKVSAESNCGEASTPATYSCMYPS